MRVAVADIRILAPFLFRDCGRIRAGALHVGQWGWASGAANWQPWRRQERVARRGPPLGPGMALGRQGGEEEQEEQQQQQQQEEAEEGDGVGEGGRGGRGGAKMMLMERSEDYVFTRCWTNASQESIAKELQLRARLSDYAATAAATAAAAAIDSANPN